MASVVASRAAAAATCAAARRGSPRLGTSAAAASASTITARYGLVPAASAVSAAHAANDPVLRPMVRPVAWSQSAASSCQCAQSAMWPRRCSSVGDSAKSAAPSRRSGTLAVAVPTRRAPKTACRT